MFLQFETGPISLWCLQALHILVNQSPSVCIYVCIFCVYNHVDCLTMTSRSRASLGGNLICRSPLIWHVLLFSLLFFLHVLTSEGGSVCLGVAILCTVMSFFGVHNELSKPFVLFLFLLVPPPLPLSYCFPPTGCAFVTFATRAMAQNAIKTMHHSQTMEVLYPLAPISHFPPPPSPYILLPPCVERWGTCPSRWHPFITKHESFPKPLLLITKLHCHLQNNWIKLETLPFT